MPTLVNFFRQYLPIRFGGGPGAVIADENRVAPNQSFQPVGLQDFLALQVPPREMLLAPILPERSLAMLYAPRGIGKSWLGLTIGLAVAAAVPFFAGAHRNRAGCFWWTAKCCCPICRPD